MRAGRGRVDTCPAANACGGVAALCVCLPQGSAGGYAASVSRACTRRWYQWPSCSGSNTALQVISPW